MFQALAKQAYGPIRINNLALDIATVIPSPGVLPTNTTPKYETPPLLYAHTVLEILAMNVDMDTDDWLGCPTPLEMYQHQCSLLVDELVETERMLRRARANIAGLVQMNDLLMKGKAQAEQQLSLASSELADLKGSLTEPGVLSIRLVAGQRDHFMRENQQLLAELRALKEPQP